MFFHGKILLSMHDLVSYMQENYFETPLCNSVLKRFLLMDKPYTLCYNITSG